MSMSMPMRPLYFSFVSHSSSSSSSSRSLASDDIASGRKPYLAKAVTPVAAAIDPPPDPPPLRKRPLVFVYDLDTAFGSDLLQVVALHQ